MDSFISKLFSEAATRNNINDYLYDDYSVKKGLRNEDNTGVLVGLTRISDVHGYNIDNGKKVDDEGHLYYRGIDIFDLACKIDKDIIEGFEEVCFLILFGRLPTRKELDRFKGVISDNYELQPEFIALNLLRHPSSSVMNKTQRALLMMYSYDVDPDNADVLNVLEKGLEIIGQLPAIICYAYHGKNHHFNNESLYIHHPLKNLSIAENVLSMIRPDSLYTRLEAEILDLALIVHADHGGGNNSTFTNVVISSSGTDIYSALAGAVGSLKGPRHGGANAKVLEMMDNIVNEVGYTMDKKIICKILNSILDKKFNDSTGLIYGIGHAVYTKSDPRSVLLKEKARKLSIEKGELDKFEFYDLIENCAIEEIKKRKAPGFNICSNVDFYSGFVYSLLQIPRDLYTPLFVLGRTVGWIAHNIENKLYGDKIIRPATKYVGEKLEYETIDKRK